MSILETTVVEKWIEPFGLNWYICAQRCAISSGECTRAAPNISIFQVDLISIYQKNMKSYMEAIQTSQNSVNHDQPLCLDLVSQLVETWKVHHPISWRFMGSGFAVWQDSLNHSASKQANVNQRQLRSRCKWYRGYRITYSICLHLPACIKIICSPVIPVLINNSKVKTVTDRACQFRTLKKHPPNVA